MSLARVSVRSSGSLAVLKRTIAADIGTRQYGHQVEAMYTLRASPTRYLLTPILWAMLLSTPLLTAISYASACAASLIVFTWSHPQQGPDYWQLFFHRDLLHSGQIWFTGTHWLLAKLLVSGVGIGLLAYHRGLAPKHSSTDVSRSARFCSFAFNERP